MKSFVVSIIIAAVVISGSLFSTHQIEKVSETLSAENSEITEFLKNEDFEKALRLTEDMEDYVNKKKLSLAIIMDHSDLDKIELSIAELKGYVEGNIRTDALAKCSMLDVLLRHMPKNYNLKIENIL